MYYRVRSRQIRSQQRQHRKTVCTRNSMEIPIISRGFVGHVPAPAFVSSSRWRPQWLRPGWVSSLWLRCSVCFLDGRWGSWLCFVVFEVFFVLFYFLSYIGRIFFECLLYCFPVDMPLGGFYRVLNQPGCVYIYICTYMTI